MYDDGDGAKCGEPNPPNNGRLAFLGDGRRETGARRGGGAVDEHSNNTEECGEVAGAGLDEGPGATGAGFDDEGAGAGLDEGPGVTGDEGAGLEDEPDKAASREGTDGDGGFGASVSRVAVGE